MTTTLIVLIYLLSILGMRKICRLHAKYEVWLKKDCTMDAFWFIPFMNTLALIVCSLCLWHEISNVKGNNKTLNWLTNKDLL